MSFSKIIQLFHFVNHRIQCKKYIFISIFLLTLHLFYYFYLSKSLTSSLSLHVSSEESIFMSIFVSIIVPVVVSIAVAFLISLVDVMVFWALNKYNEHLLNDNVERGTRPEIDVSDDEFVSRPLIVDRLKTILRPCRNQSYYHVISGEHGTGKTDRIK